MMTRARGRHASKACDEPWAYTLCIYYMHSLLCIDHFLDRALVLFHINYYFLDLPLVDLSNNHTIH